MTKVTPAMVLEWQTVANGLAKEYPSKNPGFPDGRRRVYEALAQRYGVNLRTVYRYMNPTESRSYRSPVYVKRRYERLYRRLRRHVDSLLPHLYNGNPELSLPEMSERIEAHAGIRIREATLEKLLARYEDKPRGPPVIKTESGYRLNPAYYSSPSACSTTPRSPQDQQSPV